MTGPEHYAEAERLLDTADRQIGQATPNTVVEVMAGAKLGIAAAQSHATLALAAATALPTGIVDWGLNKTWQQVAT